MAAALSSFFAPKRNTAVAEESLVVEDELWNHIHRRDEALPHRRRAVDETYFKGRYQTRWITNTATTLQ
jgi:hypothetical protein